VGVPPYRSKEFGLFLPAAEVEPVLDQLRVAFPHLTEWQYCNKSDFDHFGFTVWGCFTMPDHTDSLTSRRFYVTFDLYENQWRGTLSIGMHNYLWSSADMGDAILANTEPCADLTGAVGKLKEKIADLARAFSVL